MGNSAKGQLLGRALKEKRVCTFVQLHCYTSQNKVHFNQNLGSKSSAFQSESKASAAASPAADFARRAWLRRTREDGGTPIRFESSAGEVVALGLNRSFSQFDSNKVAAERIELNFDQNSDQNKVFQKEM